MISRLAGEMCIREPRLLAQVPAQRWAHPWPWRHNDRPIAAVNIMTAGNTVLFKPKILSVNSNLVNTKFGYENPNVQTLVKWLELPSLRFPGGTVGNYYKFDADGFYCDAATLRSTSRKTACGQLNVWNQVVCRVAPRGPSRRPS